MIATAENLKRLRQLACMSQHDLANELNVAQSQISMWERGMDPSLMSPIKICDVFGISIDEFVGRTNEQIR